jgi:type IV fimbrial biogenesis protein FimT
MKGFTLIELLTTLAILGCLSILSFGSYSYLMRANEQQIIIDELKTAIQYAKMQALGLDNSVILTPLDSSHNWAKGMVLSTWDKKTNTLKILYQWQWNHPCWILMWKGLHSSDKIIFSSYLASAMSNGHFTLSNRVLNQNISIILNRLGRVRVESK